MLTVALSINERSGQIWLADQAFNAALKHTGPQPPHKILLELATEELGVREKTGNNDGERVEAYLRAVGLKSGQPWCAAYVSWVFKQAGYAAPRTGWSPALFPASRLVKSPVPGSLFSIYFPALKRIGHCGFVAELNGDLLISLEGNTNPSGSRNGDGVYKRVRHRRSIRSFANWIKKGGAK